MNSRLKAYSLSLIMAGAAIVPGLAGEVTTDIEPGSVLTLEQCRSMAMSNNKMLRRMAYDIRAARYQKEEAFAAYLPAIDFAGGYMYNQKKIAMFDKDQYLPVKQFDIEKQSYEWQIATNPMTGEPLVVNGQPVPEKVAYLPKSALEYDIHNVFFGAVTLTQPIFMGGKIVAMNKITGYAEEIAQARRSSQARDVVYAVDAAYWELVSLRAKQRLASSYVNLLDTLRSNVDAMLREGVATRRDLLAVDVKLNSAKVDMTKVENGLQLCRMALAQLCGFPIHTPYTVTDESETALSEAPLVERSQQPVDMNEVYDRRDDLRQLELGVKVYKQKENVARSEMLPTLALVGAYSFSNPNVFDGFKNRFAGAFSVGAMLKVPLWHWGGNYNKLRAAKAETEALKMELENAREMIDLQVSQAGFKADEAVKTCRMTASNLAEADENLRCASLGFKDGVMTVDDVMEAQTGWLKAHSEDIDARIDLYLCDVYLSKVLGTLSTPSLTEIK
ncbi:MAG: TolC family protein [Bacteroides sp.]|nr:TolC family protein [Bacteroides sp.]